MIQSIGTSSKNSLLHTDSPFFTQWIMRCITPVQFAININWQQGGWFKGKRGLKQGDPLSPLLFMLTMEYLSRLFKKASTQQGFEYHQHCRKLGLTHLMFADNLIIFYKAKLASLQLLMNTFHAFTRCFGLTANLEKSSIVFGGDCSHIQQEYLNITRFTESHLPFRSLRCL